MDSPTAADLTAFANEVPSYYLNALNDFAAIGSFRGARVLEVGGSALPRPLVLEALGARQWVCVDIINHASGAYQQSAHAAHYEAIGILPLGPDAEIPDRPYAIFDGSADTIPASFFGRFDVVFSINAFEHVLPLPEVLRRCHQALRPGGILFSQFGPIWSCIVGSHFWVRSDFCFNTPGPMPPWGHLLHDRAGMDALLQAAGASDDDRHHALYQLYESSFVNRWFFEDYEVAMAGSPFVDTTVQGLWHAPVPADTQRLLEQRHPGRHEFAAYGIRITARRATTPARARLRVDMPGLTGPGPVHPAASQALLRLCAAAARAQFGPALLALLRPGGGDAAFMLTPWPETFELPPTGAVLGEMALLAADAKGGDIDAGDAAAFGAGAWLAASEGNRIEAWVRRPEEAVARLWTRPLEDSAWSQAELQLGTCFELWNAHARRLLRLAAATPRIDWHLLDEGISLTPLPPAPPRSAALHAALVALAAIDGGQHGRAAEFAQQALRADDAQCAAQP